MRASQLNRLTQMPRSTKNEFIRQLRLLGTMSNELKTDHNALATKLDNDATVTDNNYNALHASATADVSLT